MSQSNTPANVGSMEGLGLLPVARPMVDRLRDRQKATKWTRGVDMDYATVWEPDALCQEAAAEIETLRTQLAHWKSFAAHAEGEHAAWKTATLKVDGELMTMRGEREVLVRLLVEADKVLGTIDGESQEEWDMLAVLRRKIAAATIPLRPEEADLLSLRARIGA